MRRTRGPGGELHPSFLGLDDHVSAGLLAERFRITQRQAARFLRETGSEGKSWRQLQESLGFGERFPVCYRPDEVSRMLAVSKSSVYRWAREGVMRSVPGLRPVRAPANFFSEIFI